MKSTEWLKNKSRKQEASQRDWTKTFPYATLVLLATLTTAAVGAYKAMQQPTPPVQPTPTPTPAISPTPSPTLTPNTRNPLTDADVERQRQICNEWISEGSGKRYNFVCRSKDTFDVFAHTGRRSEKVGTGMILEDNSIETDVMISPQNPKAPPRNSHWRLKLSDDKKLRGTHSGDDPRETFSLVFRRAR